MRAFVWTALAAIGIAVVARAVGLDPITDLIQWLRASLLTALAAKTLSHYLGWFTAGLVVLFLVSYRHRDVR